MHIKRLKFLRRDHEDQFALRPFHDRSDRDRPHRRETGAAGGKDNAAGMIWPEKGASERPGQPYAVSDTDIPSQFGRYDSVGKPSDVEVHQPIVGPALQWIGGAIKSRRKSVEL